MGSFYSTKEILDQLDNCAQDYTFPMLDHGYVYLGDTRLSAYRDDERWALIIEVLGYNVKLGSHEGLHNCLYCFGNCLKHEPGAAWENYISVTEDGPESPIFDDEYGWYVRKDATSIRIRELIVPLKLSSPQLAEKGIKLAEEPQLMGADLMRSLLPEYREQLLATEAEIRAEIPSNLPLILRLDEWHHPDLAGGELPSESETFQMIAEVLVTGDESRYQIKEPANTHWRNWPEGGTL